jgi:hypothetical protein
VLIPIYGCLFGVSGGFVRAPSTAAFFVLVAVWVEGQGMHLAANSIGHLLEGTPASEAAQLTYTYDEVVSHYLWHLGVVGLALLFLWQDHITQVPDLAFGRARLIAAGVLHGLLLFIIFVEAQTVALGLPSVILIAASILIADRAEIGRRPVRLFYLVAALLALALLAGWGFYWRGFPEFSALGFIR